MPPAHKRGTPEFGHRPVVLRPAIQPQTGVRQVRRRCPEGASCGGGEAAALSVLVLQALTKARRRCGHSATKNQRQPRQELLHERPPLLLQPASSRCCRPAGSNWRGNAQLQLPGTSAVLSLSEINRTLWHGYRAWLWPPQVQPSHLLAAVCEGTTADAHPQQHSRPCHA